MNRFDLLLVSAFLLPSATLAQSPQYAAGFRISQVNVINPQDGGPNADDEYYFILHPGASCFTPDRTPDAGIPDEGSRGISSVEIPIRPNVFEADTIQIGVWEKGGGDYDCATDPGAVEAGSDERLGVISITGSSDGVRVGGELIAGTRVPAGAIYSEAREVSVPVRASNFHYDITLSVYGKSLEQGGPPV
jgi:hypothetical protein